MVLEIQLHYYLAFCDCTLTVAMVMLQEPYIPKHVYL